MVEVLSGGGGIASWSETERFRLRASCSWGMVLTVTIKYGEFEVGNEVESVRLSAQGGARWACYVEG